MSGIYTTVLEYFLPKNDHQSLAIIGRASGGEAAHMSIRVVGNLPWLSTSNLQSPLEDNTHNWKACTVKLVHSHHTG